MGDEESERLRQRILGVPYGSPQRQRDELLPQLREGGALLLSPGDKRHDHGSSPDGPMVDTEIIQEADIVDLQPLPRQNALAAALAHAGTGVINEALLQLDEWVESW